MIGIREIPNNNPLYTLSPEERSKIDQTRVIIRRVFTNPEFFSYKQIDLLKQILDNIDQNIITTDNFDLQVSNNPQYSFLIEEEFKTGLNLAPLPLLRALIDQEICREVELLPVQSRGFRAKR